MIRSGVKQNEPDGFGERPERFASGTTAQSLYARDWDEPQKHYHLRLNCPARVSYAVWRKMRRSQSRSLLKGRIFDDRGNPMSLSHANKKGVQYRYCVSQAILQNRKSEAGSVSRVSGPDTEAIIVDSVRQAIVDRNDAASNRYRPK
jgi:hypothetical protein